jgi:hypothetical protein
MELTQSTGKTYRAFFQLDYPTVVGLMLFMLLLPFHLVIKKTIPGPVGTYWKEILLALLVTLWMVQCLLSRRLLLSGTPLDWAVLAYLGLLLLRFALDRSGWVGAWGLYVSAMYAPLFWLIPSALRDHHRRTIWLVALLVGVGAIVALGGLIEFVLDVSLWPSDEIAQRLGHSDYYVYGTHVRRVYLTFDSPTALANTLALLLPLALALMLMPSPAIPSEEQGRWKWVRPTAGLAAALMAACIIVTFSRGIWVATALSLLTMGLLSGFVHRNWKPLLAISATLVLAALTWNTIAAVRAGQAAKADRGVVELSPAAFAAMPVTGVAEELLRTEPAYGKADPTKTWTLLDPITGQDDTRPVLYQHPPESGRSEVIYQVAVPERGALRFAIALAPDVWSPEKGDGASFQIYVTEPGAPEDGRFAFVRYINPKHNPSDRRWRNFVVDLSPWAGRTIDLYLITDGGPAGDWAFDWGGWAEPQLVSIDPGIFESVGTENAVVRHVRSILDWVRDETNRDRLAAWNLALDAWREARLWGSGLGSTGAAALRTMPERAFVTESQMLKALVELGIPGLLVWCYLWFQIVRIGYRTYRTTDDPTRRVLLLGILTGLLVIFIEGWVYQNLEVKQVNAYFWTLVGTLAFLARQDTYG